MKFHGITMVGPFVNQKLVTLPIFDPNRDQGRLAWLTDGTLWYGTDTEWTSFGGSGDANEVEDMYSDLLRTTIFMNASFDEFAVAPDDDDSLVAVTTMSHNLKTKEYTYSAGQYIESVDVYDPDSAMTFVDYVLVSVDYLEDGDPTIQVTSNGGINWFSVLNNRLFRIPTENAGLDLRIRFVGQTGGVGDTGTLKSWGVLYNKDLTAACTKYGLTYSNFEAFQDQDTFELDYQPGAIQVFLNGDLLDMSDYTATDGLTVVLETPLQEGDIVYVISYSTSILDPNVDFNDFVNRDGSTPMRADLPLGGHKIVDLDEGTNPTDAVNLQQLTDLADSIPDIPDHSNFILNDGTVSFTADQSMGSNNLVDVADAVNPTDAVNLGQLSSFVKDDGTTPFTADQSMGSNKITNLSDGTLVGDAVNLGQLNSIQVLPTITPAVSITGGIYGGDIQKAGANQITILPTSCFDSTGTVPLYVGSNQTITLPSTPYTLHHIFIVRLVAGGVITYKTYTSESAAASDATIDAYRWLDFWNTDGVGSTVYCQTTDGIKHYANSSTTIIASSITSASWASLNVNGVAPINHIKQWLAGASWSGGSTTLPDESSVLELSYNGSVIHCYLKNYQGTPGTYFWGNNSSYDSVNVYLPPSPVYVRRSLNGTGPSANAWFVSLQKVELRR